jgi:integrase
VPIERFFTEKEIEKIVKRSSQAPFAHRNTALIMAATSWMLTPFELTELRLKDVMDKNGEFYRIWTLPTWVAQNGVAREIETADHINAIMIRYIDWWKANGLYESGLESYCGRKSDAPFILNDNFEAYSLSKREKNGADVLPISMNNKLNSFIEKSGFKGATASAFRDSAIRIMYENGAEYKELKYFTGIKTNASLDKKIRPHEVEISQVLNRVFKNIK